MRLWSLHPSYLDGKGLVALWREGLLARKVLRGETRGYRSHPQLERFRAHASPREALDRYLTAVLEEAMRRGFHFDGGKIGPDPPGDAVVSVTEGQLAFELEHLKAKLQRRSPEVFREIAAITEPEPHPLFTVVPGDVEPWERGAEP